MNIKGKWKKRIKDECWLKMNGLNSKFQKPTNYTFISCTYPVYKHDAKKQISHIENILNQQIFLLFPSNDGVIHIKH